LNVLEAIFSIAAFSYCFLARFSSFLSKDTKNYVLDDSFGVVVIVLIAALYIDSNYVYIQLTIDRLYINYWDFVKFSNQIFNIQLGNLLTY
jgi:hypothetical protein